VKDEGGFVSVTQVYEDERNVHSIRRCEKESAKMVGAAQCRGELLAPRKLEMRAAFQWWGLR
jgi:hypothetical protein